VWTAFRDNTKYGLGELTIVSANEAEFNWRVHDDEFEIFVAGDNVKWENQYFL